MCISFNVENTCGAVHRRWRCVGEAISGSHVLDSHLYDLFVFQHEQAEILGSLATRI